MATILEFRQLEQVPIGPVGPGHACIQHGTLVRDGVAVSRGWYATATPAHGVALGPHETPGAAANAAPQLYPNG